MYEQVDGVNWGGSLGWVLTKIIMTGCKKLIAGKLTADDILTFYVRYVYATLLVIKRAGISYFIKKFNSMITSNLQLTILKTVHHVFLTSKLIQMV